MMNTPAHLLLGGALAARGGPRLMAWGMLGGLLPDVSLYVLAGTSLFLLRIPPEVVFDELYFSLTWQTIFAIDNSAFLWAGALALAWRFRAMGAVALCAGALTHIALYLPLHAGDGRPHFWPLTDWVFDSPFSYWDREHFAAWVAPVEAAWAVLCTALLWRAGGWIRAVFIILLLAELWVVRQWLFIFGQ